MDNFLEPTDEMKSVFNAAYKNNPENFNEAILRLKEYGCSQLMTIRVMMVEQSFSLFEAQRIFHKSGIWN